MTETTADLPTFPKVRGACPFDPPPEYVDWNSRAGLTKIRVWNDVPAWLATGAVEVRTVLTDPRFSSNPSNGMPAMGPRDGVSPANRTFIRMDDPDHARLRKMVMREFRLQHVQARRSQLEQFTTEHLDRMVASGPTGDLVADFALPIPSLAIADLLGVAPGQEEVFQRTATVLMSLGSTADEIGVVVAELFGYLHQLVAQKRAEPGDDLVSRLVVRYAMTGEITDEEVVLACFLLLAAGHETTANMITMAALALMEHPDQLEQFLASDEPADVDAAIEELLRYLSIISNGPVRVAMEDVLVGEQLVRRGEGVIINIPTANRSPEVCPEPDSLDVTRRDTKHLAFGAGSHQCLGMHLARLELTIALPALFRRLPGLRLDAPMDEIAWRNQSLVFGAYHLPVRWDL